MKKVLTFAIAVAVASALGVGVSMAKVNGSTPTVRALGDETFEVNALIQATFRFSPMVIDVPSGGTLRFIKQDNAPDEPHTLSIVSQGQLPTDVEGVFNCGACNRILDEHFGGSTPKLRVDPDGDGGLDTPGDSILILPGVNNSISQTVTAPPGTTLHFMCAIHPWMQGEIKVTG